jgi:hypothetical protein
MFMKKLYVFMTALLALFAINANADRILYSENYEAGGVPATWTINGGTGSVAGDEEGKYFSFALGNSNGRSAHCLWGESVYDAAKEGLTEYTVSFEFQMQAFGNNQYNGEIALFSGEKCPKTNGNAGGNWSDFNTVTPNCFFSLTQSEAAIKAMDTKDPSLWYFMGDVDNNINLTAGTWYAVTATVNVATREVAWTLDDFDGTVHKAGTKTLAEDANMYISGLYLMDARYWSVINVDNIKVAVPGDYANVPVIALTGLNKAERTYTISFMEGETLHVTNTDGSQNTVAYNDCEGKYVISTTTSGTISAYTTAGAMTSETATMEVVCEPIVLPVPTYGIIAADEGYAKTYQFSVDNSTVEMQPVIYIDIKFEGEGGTVIESKNNEKVATIAVPSKGKITVTTKDLNGYYDNGTATILNDIEYTIKHDIDIQHITAEQLIEKGFEKMDDLNSGNTSGESNWTGRLRNAFGIATGEKDEEQNDIYKYYAVYGPDANGVDKDGNTLSPEWFAGAKCDFGAKPAANFDVVEPIQRYRFLQSKLNAETAHSLFAPMYVWYGTTGVDKSYYEEDGVTPKVDPAGNPGGTTNLQVKLGIGIVFSGQVNDAENYNPNSISYSPILINTTTMGVDGLTDDDLIVVSKVDNYGGGSVHPQFPAGTDPAAAKAEYKAMHLGAVNSTCKGTETFSLNRVDTALNRVLVLSQKNGTGIDNMNYNKVVSDHNAPVYNLNGVQVNPNALTKGIYVKQGKKFVVK